MRAQSRLIDKLCRNLPPGRVEWIGVRPARKAEMIEVNSVNAVEGFGLEGDHRVKKTRGSARQVTIVSSEFIAQITAHLQKEDIHPSLLRRNIVVSGMNLNALRYQQFKIGQAIFEASALCHPCARMESALGVGGVAAMLGYGGLCAKIIEGGEVSVGDAVIKLDRTES